MKFINKIKKRMSDSESMVCVGLDSRYDKIPDFIKVNRSISESIFNFNKQIIDHTIQNTATYKINLSFYAAFGVEGLLGLEKTNEYIKSNYPELTILADCKRSEMGQSVNMVKSEIFDWLKFDCVMVTPWFGSDTIRDYLVDDSKGVCVYVHDSNPSAFEVQDLELKDGRRVYEAVTELAIGKWNSNGNVFIEAGATYPEQLKRVREISGDEMLILTAGVGAQGAKVTDIDPVVFGKNNNLLVNSSRGIIFAGTNQKDYFDDVSKAALKLKDELNVQTTKNSSYL